MWQWLLKRQVNSAPKNANQLASAPVIVDDDYLAVELFLRTVSSIRDDDIEKDFVQRFSRAASQIELPIQIRMVRFEIRAWFMLFHPLLCMRMMLMKYILANPSLSNTKTTTQIALIRSCQSLLDDVEFGRSIPARARKAMKELAIRSHWSGNQLRKAVITGTVVAAKPQYVIEIRKPSKLETAVLIGSGLSLVIPALLIAVYGLIHFAHCSSLDCVLLGAMQLTVIGCIFGVLPLKLYWTKISLYNAAYKD